MKTILPRCLKAYFLIALSIFIATTSLFAQAPELSFINPVLTSGTDNREGAIYRFANVTTGVDAELKLKKFSRPDIVMNSVDNSSYGWSKALQPEFGLPGIVAPYQNWYIDFEMTFFQAGTSIRQKMQMVDLTALDVDGDGWSISEYAVFQRPVGIVYSSVSYLTGVSASLLGESQMCTQDSIASSLVNCTMCSGLGALGITECSNCSGTGMMHEACGHGYEGATSTTVQGPIDNFVSIDTSATQVMATYQYIDTDILKFRYGAKSAANSSNGSGVRLNSIWFRQFSLQPPTTLPVKLTYFNAVADNKTVALSWAGNEENFGHYIVQRSIDGKTFTDIALVLTNGTTTVSSGYKFKDANVPTTEGKLFYRLKMVDNTKEFTYSPVKFVRFNIAAEGLRMTAYPNPATDQVQLQLPATWQGKKVRVELFTITGVRIRTIEFSTAAQTESLNLSELVKGGYLIKATNDGEAVQQRIIKN